MRAGVCLLIIGLLYTSVLSEWASVFLLGVLVGWLGPGLVGTARFLVNLFIFPMDNYDLQHTLLNFDSVPTRWMNWGIWPGPTKEGDFRQACCNLAHKLAEVAKLSKGDHVLDVGFGCGDQDLFWFENFGPLSIEGINVSKVQVAAAQKLISKFSLDHAIKLSHGSAPILKYNANAFDKILSLDSAYHFNTREKFFSEAFRVLKPGGCVGLADIIFDFSASEDDGLSSKIQRGFFEWMVSLLLGIPKENFYSLEIYKAKLVKAGFVDIQAETIPSEFVWESFLRWIRKQQQELGEFTKEGALKNFETAARFMTFLAKRKVISLVVVRSYKPVE